MPLPKIFYLMYDIDAPSGGEKHSYQHVDLLNSNGFQAYALHKLPRYRHTWFENETRVIDMETFWNIYDRERDYIVVPEPFGRQILTYPGKLVIFNKNLYTGFKAFGSSAVDTHVYNDPRIAAVFSVSEHNLQHLRFAFPGARFYRMFAHIDCKLFAYRPPAEKRKIIACVSKAWDPTAILFHTLLARNRAGLNNINQFRWIFLRGQSERDMASILQDAAILVSLSTYEGLPRTVLEAMACGCLPVCYGTGPLKEMLPVEARFEPDDLVAAATYIESVAREFPAISSDWALQSARGRKIAEAFSLERQREHLLTAWEEICRQ